MKKNDPEKVNTESGLSQERFAALFGDLNEDAFKALLEKAGLTEEMADEIIAEAETEEAPKAKAKAKAAAKTKAAAKPAVQEKPKTKSKKAEAAAVAPPEDSGLTPEMVGRLLKHIDGETLNRMLASAGLAEEAKETPKAKTKAAAKPKAQEKPKTKSKKAETAEAVAVKAAAEKETPAEVTAEVTTEPEADAKVAQKPETEAAEEAANTALKPEAEAKEALAEAAPEVPAEEKSEREAETDKAESKEAPAAKEEAKAEDEEAPAAKEAKAEDEEAPAAESKKKKASKGRKRPPKAVQFAIILVGLFLLAFAFNKVYMSARINTDDPIVYSTPVDEISCSEGTLTVNNVSISVPSDGTEEYDISYSWAEEDEQYPSVPHAINVTYSDGEGNKIYSISFYRNDTVLAADVESGKTAENWFDDWKTYTKGDVRQEPLQAGDIHGFYIYPAPAESADEQNYNDYSYYFAVEGPEGISTYVIEGICIDPEQTAGFPQIMDACIKSITISEPESEAEGV